MVRVTKIFRFEMAHALSGYDGPCKNIHGHSYELHVSVSPAIAPQNYLPAPGFVMDFKVLKNIVKTAIIDQFDHKLLLSKHFLSTHPSLASEENLVTWDVEPSAENLLIYTRQTISGLLPDDIKLAWLKLYETEDSYAEWLNEATFTAN